MGYSANIENPVIIIGAPRSGTTLLFSILASSPALWCLYAESETVFHPHFHPSRTSWRKGNRLDEHDLTAELRDSLRQDFYRRAMNFQRWLPNLKSRIHAGSPVLERLRRALGTVSRLGKPGRIRLLEKTPKNCLRVPFMNALFPDARFVFLTREGRANVASLLEGWLQGGRYRSYKMPVRLDIEGYAEHRQWTFALPPGWEGYCQGHTLAEVCAFQYAACNDMAFADLVDLAPRRVFQLRYEELTRRPRECVRELCEFLNLEFGGAVAASALDPPRVNTTTAPSPEKWKRHADEIATVHARIRPTMERLGYPVDELA